MGFDVQGAKQAGYSDAEIADHLGSESKFDVSGARKAGYTDSEIITHLMGGPAMLGAPSPAPQKPQVRARGGDWGQGFPKFADWLASFVASTAEKDLGLSPKVAAIPGAVTYGLAQAIPMLATATRAGPGMAAAEVPSLMSKPARWMLQSAVKPSSMLPAQDVKAGLNTMLAENIYPTSAGMNKATGITKNLDEQVGSILAQSPATVSVPAVTSRLDELLSKVGKQVNPQTDTAAVEKTWTDFLTNPHVIGQPTIPVQLAHELKQGTYASLGGKSYGEVGSASTEAQKQLARGLREEVAAAVPEVSPLLARQAALMNVKDVAGTRALIEANKNPLGLAALRMDNPLSAATFMADRWAALKAFLAMQMYSAGKPQVFGPALMAPPGSGPALMGLPTQVGALYPNSK